MNKTFPWTPALVTGVIVGVSSSIMFSVVDHFNQQLGWGMDPMKIRGLTGIVTLVILGIGIYTGMSGIKRQQKGILLYKQAVLTGAIIALVTGVITAVFTFIYCQVINPHFAADMLAESKKIMVAQAMPATVVESNLAGLEKQLTTPSQVMQAFVGQLIGGTFISLVIGLFIKTKK